MITVIVNRTGVLNLQYGIFNLINMDANSKDWIVKFAKPGLVAKGIVYLTLGALAFMAAFRVQGRSGDDASREGAFQFMKETPAGPWLLGLVTAGLVCYIIWRWMQAFGKNDQLKWKKRLRYFLSGLAYASIAYSAVRMITNKKSGGNKNQEWSQQILEQPFGQVALGIAALVLTAIGFYQVWYGLSEKYKEHVQGLNLHSKTSKALMASGKIGYVARGIVWLILSFLLFRAALHNNAGEAGGSSEAFRFIEASWGPWVMGAVAFGLIAYGIFNFIRARYEDFRSN
jgi:hypothetical protein